MKRLNIDILGISETWLPGVNDFFVDEGYKIYCSGNNTPNHRNGVAVIITKKIASSVEQCIPLSDRALLLKIKAKSISLNIIQVYAPTADKSDEIIENFYSELSELTKFTRPHEMNIIMGDFNAKIGLGRVDNIVGPFALGNRNDRGDRLIQFCQEESLTVTNTWFSLPRRRLYTWKSPQDTDGNIVRNQIDFILINRRFHTSVSKVRTCPGADVSSNHNLLLSKIKIKLSKSQSQHRPKRLNLDKLEDSEFKSRLTVEINTNLRSLDRNDNLELEWNQMKNTLNTVAERNLGPKNFTPKKKWMTEEIINLMAQRRKHRNKSDQEYKRIQRLIRSKIRQEVRGNRKTRPRSRYVYPA
ncbi:craniofacial development protein 2-like [Condylostylus longicornis]|uniref:craniofacial development protein 2-like n=1 Tax=Condylostylus longicornis TaxID=2530218 RepID=UPI00244DC2AD|nr:craniofacial development protein 2-like [Condylostylus longicornis]